MRTSSSISHSTQDHAVNHSTRSHHAGRFIGNPAEKSEPFFTPVNIQPKLQIGRPNDRYEREADRIADHITRGSYASAGNKDSQSDRLQMKCNSCRHDEEVQRNSIIQQKSEKNTTASSEISRKINSAKGSGHPLPVKTQQEMGEKMGVDFTDVRIHTGSHAIQMNKEIGARAFTTGNEIFFNRDEFNTNSRKGEHLLAHELVHTIQQSSGMSSGKIQKQDNEEEQPLPRVPLPHELSGEFYMNVLENSDSEADVETEEPSSRSRRSPRVRTRGSVDETGRFRVRTRAQYKLAPDLTLGPLQFFETLSVESGVSGGSLEAISPDDRLFSEQTRIALSLISMGWEAGELPGSPSGGLTLETRGQIARDISVSGMPANWSFTPDVRLRWQLFELESPQTPFGRFTLGAEATSAIEAGSEGPSDSHELSAELGWRHRLIGEEHPAIRNLDLFITFEGSMEWNELLSAGEVTGRPSFSGTLHFGTQFNF